MSRTASVFGLGREFDDFLFAPIGVEPNGMLLSVVSALARSKVDPWQEAAQLARLPAKTATQRLTALIAALPGARFDAGPTAARLIALLPRPGVATAAPPEAMFGGAANRILGNRSVVALAIVWTLLLGIQFIATSHQPAPQAASGIASGPGTITSQAAKVPTGR